MRKPRKLVWRLFFSYIFIALGALVAAGWYFTHSLDAFLEEETAVELFDRARLIENQIVRYLDPPDLAAVDAICKISGKASETRFTVILPSGTVIGDTWETPRNMDNHAARPEIAGALANGKATSRRFSNTLQQNVVYVAVAVKMDSQPIGVIRAAIPLARMEAQVARIRTEFWVIGGIVALLALGVTLAISRQYGRKMDELKQGAARLAEGELAHRLAIPNSEELAGLAESLNRMAAQLESRMQTVVSQRNQLEAVLSSMLEGVIAISRDERIISVNQAAARWFDIDPEKVRGRSIPEAIRNLAIQKFVARSVKSRTPVEDDIAVYRNGERILNIKSAPLLDVGPEPIGMLVVFSDVTQLRRLEDMRRDFVANVSHEIKTPLTAIKGFVETLHQNTDATPEEAERFLGIISRHVDRLNTIIEDLLMLSRIENEGERGDVKREKTRLRDIFQNAVQICRPRADEKRIQIELGGAPRAGRGEPFGQRRQIQRPREGGAGAGKDLRKRNPAQRAGPRDRHREKASSPAVRTLLPRRQGSQPGCRRDGFGAGHRQTHRPGPWRPRHGGEQPGRREPLHHPPAAGSGALLTVCYYSGK
jgi:two-component system, OmpR family, phosphate regulon sensor histidine kinase PhoR